MLEQLAQHFDSFGAAALGALLGSLSAFALGLLTERLRKLEKRHSALLATQYALMSQWTVIESIRRDVLEKWRDDAQRFSKLPVYYAPGIPTRVPVDEITFITSTTDADLLQQIHIAQQKFEACMETLRLRNEKVEEFYRDPSIERQDFDFETGRSVITAPPYKFFFIRRLTDHLYEQIDSSLPKLRREIESVEKFIKKRFPGRNALKFVDLNAKIDPAWKRWLRRSFNRRNLRRTILLLGTAAVLLFAVRVLSVPIVARAQFVIASVCLVSLLFAFRTFDRWLAE